MNYVCCREHSEISLVLLPDSTSTVILAKLEANLKMYSVISVQIQSGKFYVSK